ncbi:MAG: SMP-30/gluconolactonase/LRE family protein [Verrucomicrobiaceae bacterium]|nr:SMP-30/gluconolactonase/LRE family protein [Verrucomicrobiaceae bacterium]
MNRLFLISLATASLLTLTTGWGQNTLNFPALGRIVESDPKLAEVLDKSAELEVLGSGFDWAEGPVWVRDGKYLLFSDIPPNQVVKWEEGKGISTFLQPSGYTGATDYGGEPGSNGLLLDGQGRLVSCEHGDRRVSVMTKDGGKRTLVDNYEGKRLNSPNDAVYKSNGDLYFTDPPYGLPKRYEDRRRELDWCGVYRLSKDGKVTLLTKEMTRPNGIAFSPDEKILYVAQSDPKAALWKAFPVQDDGTLGDSRVFYDATSLVGKLPGLPDGLKVDKKGNLWATGPGGVHIFAADGTPLGRIETGEATANCGWGDDGTVLYITADMYLCRIQTKVTGLGF